MNFEQALQKLGIEKYKGRIFNSNSHGELLHLQQYIGLAEILESNSALSLFPEWFEEIVKQAEAQWDRPESVFQHIDKLLLSHINAAQ